MYYYNILHEVSWSISPEMFSVCIIKRCYSLLMFQMGKDCLPWRFFPPKTKAIKQNKTKDKTKNKQNHRNFLVNCVYTGWLIFMHLVFYIVFAMLFFTLYFKKSPHILWVFLKKKMYFHSFKVVILQSWLQYSSLINVVFCSPKLISEFFLVLFNVVSCSPKLRSEFCCILFFFKNI